MKRLTVAIFLPLALALAACGGSATAAGVESAASVAEEVLPPVPTRPLASLLPAAPDLLGHVDFEALAASSAYTRIKGSVDAIVTEVAGPENLDSLANGEAYFAAGFATESVLVAFRPTAVVEESALVDATWTLEQRGRHSYYTSSNQGVIAFVGEGTILMGTADWVDAALEAQDSGEGQGVTDAVIQELMGQIAFGERPIAAVMKLSPNAARAMELPSMVSEMVDSAAASAAFGEGLELALVVNAKNSLAANMAVTLARGQITELMQDPEVKTSIIGALLRELSLSVEGSAAWARLPVAPEQLDALLSVAQSMTDAP